MYFVLFCVKSITTGVISMSKSIYNQRLYVTRPGTQRTHTIMINNKRKNCCHITFNVGVKLMTIGSRSHHVDSFATESRTRDTIQ